MVLNPNPSPFSKDTTTNLAYIAHQVHPPMQREKQVIKIGYLGFIIIINFLMPCTDFTMYIVWVIVSVIDTKT